MPMTASGLAAAMLAAQGTANADPSVQSAANMALATAIVSYIQANATVTIPADSINTTGSPSAQVGPPSPVALTGSIS